MQSDTPRDSSPPVWNRESIIELLTREVARSDSSGTSLTVILARLDPQSTNRETGETQISFVLVEIAKRLGALLRSYDYIGRYSSRELLILVPGWESSNSKPLAEKLREAVAESPIDLSASHVGATMSFVPATSADFKSNISNEVWRQMENALDSAQEKGGNRVESLGNIGKLAHPALHRRRRIRPLWVLSGILILGIAVLVFVAPSWTCAPNLVGDIFDSGELPPPLPANCVLTTERPTATMMQFITKRREVSELEFQGAITCKILSSPRSGHSQEQWLGNLYADGRLQYRRHVLIAASQDVPGGKLFTVEQYLMPWWRYLGQPDEYCRVQDPSWK